MRPADKIEALLKEKKGYKYAVTDLMLILGLSYGETRSACSSLTTRGTINQELVGSKRRYYCG
jgi:hypothetical protein